MMSVIMVGDRALLATLKSFPDNLRRALLRRVSALTLRLEALVKGKLTNNVLMVRTGALRRSIQSRVENDSMGVVGRVLSTGDVKYAGIHEFGGRTKAHVIEARNAKALAFVSAASGGKMVFARRVMHPGSNMPERSFLRSSLEDMRAEIIRELEGAPAEALTMH